MDDVLEGTARRKRLARKLLRAWNGALLGAVAGGVLGFTLGGASAFAVQLVTGNGRYADHWPFCAVYGMIPGIPAGLFIGSLLAIPDNRKRSIAAVLIGLGSGLSYAWLLRDSLAHDAGVRIAMAASGLVGGAVMAASLRGIRRRWKWWSRWEA
ncbi:MAG: hypothetical protein ACO1SX_00010 [Actinomycetota bacterium]